MNVKHIMAWKIWNSWKRHFYEELSPAEVDEIINFNWS